MIVAFRWDTFGKDVRDLIYRRSNFGGGVVYAYVKKRTADGSPNGARAKLAELEGLMLQALSSLNRENQVTNGVIHGHNYPKWIFRRVPVTNVLETGAASGVYLFFAIRIIRLQYTGAEWCVIECKSVDARGAEGELLMNGGLLLEGVGKEEDQPGSLVCQR